MSTSNNASKDRYPPEFGVHTSHLDAARKTGNVMWFTQPDTAFRRPWPPPAAVKGIGAGLWSSCGLVTDADPASGGAPTSPSGPRSTLWLPQRTSSMRRPA